VDIGDWHTEKGEYQILIGASSRDIRLSEKVKVEADKKAETPDYSNILSEYYNMNDGILDISEKQFETLYGSKLPMRERPEGSPFTINSMLGETESKFIGRMLIKIMVKNIKKMVGSNQPDEENSMMRMMMTMIKEMPLRSFAMLGGDKMPKYMAEGLVEMLNGRFFKGLRLLRRK
jgi:beta-glucosidase